MSKVLVLRVTSSRLDNDTQQPAPVTQSAVEYALRYWGYDVEFIATPKEMSERRVNHVLEPFELGGERCKYCWKGSSFIQPGEFCEGGGRSHPHRREYDRLRYAAPSQPESPRCCENGTLDKPHDCHKQPATPDVPQGVTPEEIAGQLFSGPTSVVSPGMVAAAIRQALTANSERTWRQYKAEEVNALEAKLQTVQETLEKNQWSGGGLPENPRCTVCGGNRDSGHRISSTSGCWLAALLGQVEGEGK